jgi:cytochrome c553
MKGYVLTTCLVMVGTIAMAYDRLEYKGVPRTTSCYGECYEEYVAINGTAFEIEQKKKELAAADEFSSIRSLWAGCAACHGQGGEGMAVFPALKGKSSDYITEKLYAYRNKETVGNMSSTMWAQAGQLTDEQITTIGKYIETL